MSGHVLITGGAGYIGSILVPELLAKGHAVTVLDNFSMAQAPLLECCANPRFDIVRGDCRDAEVLKPLVKKADVIIPLAAIVGAPACKFDQTAAKTINLEAVKTLVGLRSPAQRMLYPTTNSGYGVGEKGKFCTEETPLRPISLYGTTKVEAERAVLDGGNSVTFRLATVFGAAPRMRTDLLVNDFVYRAVNDRAVVVFEGHMKRNYIHIRDVANAFMHALDNFEKMKGEAYNVGLSDANLSKLELCQRIQTHVPGFVYLEAPVGEDPDKRDYIVSNEKLEKTGWRPKHSLDDGIRELMKAYRLIKDWKYRNF